MKGFRSAQRYKLHSNAQGGRAPFEYLAVYEVDSSPEEAKTAMGEASGTGRFVISDALAPEWEMWWFESIGDRRDGASAQDELRRI